MSTMTSPEIAASARPLALIAGPTASGKSAIAVDLARALDANGRSAVIVNADSMQLYRDIPILSAAPSKAERAAIDHRLYGAWDGAEACSAAEWASRAKQEIAEAHEADMVPILVGGTGLYLKVLIEGIAPIPEIDPEVRRSVRILPVESAYTALTIEDPERAAALEPGDSQRIARALEVKRSTGVTLSDWQRAKAGGIGDVVALHPLVLMPDRTWLYNRCEARFAQMVEDGAVAEVEALLARELAPDMPVMRAIGVPEIAAFLRGDTNRDAMIATGAQSTRQYAKRQFTWLRSQAPDGWARIENSDRKKHIDLVGEFASLLRR